MTSHPPPLCSLVTSVFAVLVLELCDIKCFGFLDLCVRLLFGGRLCALTDLIEFVLENLPECDFDPTDRDVFPSPENQFTTQLVKRQQQEYSATRH